MKKLMVAVAAVVLGQGCMGGGVYHDTDVVAPKDFELKVASKIEMAGGLMLSGNLEYAGAGDLVQVYHDYIASMKSHGWTASADDISANKAIGTLRKDNRACALEFTSASGTIRATVKVSPTK
jgi:hypothetical protein